MRILLDMCVYDMRNKGNVALLQVAIRRMQECWPQAKIKVISISPHILRLYCPTADPIDRDGFEWMATNISRDQLLRTVPRPFFRLMFEVREAIWYHAPARLSSLSRLGTWRGSTASRHNSGAAATRERSIEHVVHERETYQVLLKGVDLFIATGAQYMSDACKPDAMQLLDRIEEAHKLGIPTVMVGQGIGPIRDPELQKRAAAVLRLVDLIFVRETLTAPAILESLGVSPDRIVFTGDDAIELAYELRSPSYGKSIGISIRVAAYTGIENRQLESVQVAMETAHRRYDASLIGIPISQSAHEQDDRILRRLDVRHGIGLDRFDSPADLVRRISRCRVVVTGTYHGAVFALAQGIPVVALAQSEMYFDKFRGLAEQFGDGCQIVRLDDKHFQDRMAEVVERVWSSAERFRPQLLSSAARQIELGRSAYQRISKLICPDPVMNNEQR